MRYDGFLTVMLWFGVIRGLLLTFLSSSAITNTMNIIQHWHWYQFDISLSSNDPPCRSAVLAQQELLRLVESNPEGLETMDPIKDFNIRDMDTVDLISRKSYLGDVINKYVCTGCPKLQEHVSQWFNKILLLCKWIMHLFLAQTVFVVIAFAVVIVVFLS